MAKNALPSVSSAGKPQDVALAKEYVRSFLKRLGATGEGGRGPEALYGRLAQALRLYQTMHNYSYELAVQEVANERGVSAGYRQATARGQIVRVTKLCFPSASGAAINRYANAIQIADKAQLSGNKFHEALKDGALRKAEDQRVTSRISGKPRATLLKAGMDAKGTHLKTLVWPESELPELPGWVLVLGKIVGKGRLQVYPALTKNDVVCARLVRRVALKAKAAKSKSKTTTV